VVGADRIHEWAGASMRALRLGAREPRVLHWTDLGTGEPVDVPNLGGAALLRPGETVLGRLVPTSDGSMLEGTPLQVPPEVAAAVAADPGDWVEVLRRCRPDLEDCGTAIMRGNHLLTDIPETAWQLVLLDAAGHLDGRTLTPESLAEATVTMVRAALSGHLGLAFDDQEDVDPWSCVAAALCQPHVLERLDREFTPDDVPGLLALAERLFGPAAAVCRELASTARAAA
jgi:hypothetical protein